MIAASRQKQIVHAGTTPMVFSSEPASSIKPPVAMNLPALKKVPVQPAYSACSLSDRLVMYKPSHAMSCVAEAMATKASMAMQAANQNGVCSASATSPRLMPPNSWNATTTIFLLLASSKKGLHSGLNTQAAPMAAVQWAMSSLATPMLFNICAATMATAKNGSPCAKYKLGTHSLGLRIPLCSCSMLRLSVYFFMLVFLFEAGNRHAADR